MCFLVSLFRGSARGSCFFILVLCALSCLVGAFLVYLCNLCGFIFLLFFFVFLLMFCVSNCVICSGFFVDFCDVLIFFFLVLWCLFMFLRVSVFMVLVCFMLV